MLDIGGRTTESLVWVESMNEEDMIEVETGSGNVFADLGLPDADDHLLKAQLVSRIDGIIRRRKLTQAKAGELLGLSQPDVSRLLRGHFRDFSLERLLRLLMALDRDVEIVIRRKPKSRARSQLHITAA